MASPVILPKLTYEMQEGRIIEWLAAEGEPVIPGQTLFTVETDKAAVEVPAEEPGVLLKILVQAGVTVPVGTPVAYIGAAGEMSPGAPGNAAIAETAGPEADGLIPASPIARRMARELGVDLKAVQAFSGQKRVREADVQAMWTPEGVRAKARHRRSPSRPRPCLPARQRRSLRQSQPRPQPRPMTWCAPRRCRRPWPLA